MRQKIKLQVHKNIILAELLCEEADELHHILQRKKMFIFNQFKEILTGKWDNNEKYKKHNEQGNNNFDELNKSNLY